MSTRDLPVLFEEFFREFNETLPIKLDSPVMEVRNNNLNSYLLDKVRELFSYEIGRLHDSGIDINPCEIWSKPLTEKLVRKLPRLGIDSFPLTLFFSDSINLNVTGHSNPLYFQSKVQILFQGLSSFIEVKALIPRSDYFEKIKNTPLDQLEDNLIEITIDEVKWIVK